MTIFGTPRLGRIGYVICVIFLLAFDFVKAPVEQYIMSLHDQAASALMAPTPAKAVSEAGKINGRQMPFMLKQHEDIARSIALSGKKMSKAELEARIRDAAKSQVLSFTPNYHADPERVRLNSARANYESYFMVAVFAMTAITIIGMLFVLSSRIRDIGWPQYTLWIMIAPIFLPKLLQLPLPSLAIQGLAALFYGMVAVLAFIPGEGSGGTAALPATALPRTRPAALKRQPGQFGRLGTE